MARLIGPSEASREVKTIVTSGSTKGLFKSKALRPATYYTTSAATALADVLNLDGTPISDSTVTIDAYSMLPLMQFPDGVDVIYVRVDNGPAWPVYAREDDRLDALNTAVQAAQSAATGGLVKSSNLADLPSVSTARTNLGLGSAATKSVGTTSADVAAGDAPAAAQAAAISAAATDATTKANAAQSAAISSAATDATTKASSAQSAATSAAATDATTKANAAQAAAVQRANHTGTQSADTLTDGTTNKAFLAAERTKLAGVATGATANSTDSQLRDRSTHTGTQATSTVAGLDSALAAKADQAVLLLRGEIEATDYSISSGASDNATAFNAALSDAATAKRPLHLGKGTFQVGSGLTIRSGNTIIGDGEDTVISPTAGFSANTFMTVANRTNVKVQNLTVDLANNANIGLGIYVQGGNKFRFDRLILRNQTKVNGGTLWLLAAKDVIIDDCEVTAAPRGVVLQSTAALGTIAEARVTRNRLHALKEYGVYVVGETGATADDVWIDDNKLWDIIGGSPRYPIYTTCPSNSWHRNFRIRGNRVTGNTSSFVIADNNSGTADQIAPYHLEDSVISGNISTLGGDGGIAVGESRRLVVANNVCDNNNTHGLNFEYCFDLTIVGNESYSNGRNWNGVSDTVTAPRSGIRLVGTTGSIIDGNRCHEPDTTSPVQQYGVSIYDAASVDNTLGKNSLVGNTQGEIWYHGSVAATSRLRGTLPRTTTFAYTGTTVDYPIPVDATFLILEGIGGGAGGGSGARQPVGTAAGGGGAGGGSGYTRKILPVAGLTSTLKVFVGNKGSGGAGITTNATNGAAGTSGQSTTIKDSTGTITYLRATNGVAGQGGTTAGGTAGSAGIGDSGGGAGGAGGVTAGSNGTSAPGGPGGGGGGGISAAGAAGTAGTGGYSTSGNDLATTAAGSSGVNRAPSGTAGGGSAGGGGVPQLAGAGGPGGAGGQYGAGGGGGAASNDGNTSGAGGDGATGYATITAY